MAGEEESSETVSLNEVLSAIKNQEKNIERIIAVQVNDKFENLKEEFQNSTRSFSSEVKQLREESQYKWKSEANRQQFLFNTEISTDVDQILWAIEHDKVEYCKDLIKETKEKIRKRNKLIKIADTSAEGWNTCKNYQNNPVASDSDDDSKILRAENRASRKRREKEKKKDQPKSKIPRANSVPNHYIGSPFLPASNFRLPLQNNAMYGQQGFFPVPWEQTNRFTYPPGSCFTCGSTKHYRHQCPINRSSTVSKPTE
jgi:hypothetical protein